MRRPCCLEASRAELPKQKRPLIRQTFFQLGLGGADTVASFVVDAQQYRSAARGGSLQTRSHLGWLEGGHTGIVAAGNQHDPRITCAIRYMGIRTHLVQSFKSLWLLHCSPFGDLSRSILFEFSTQCIGESYFDQRRSKKIRSSGDGTADEYPSGAAAHARDLVR